MKRSTYILIICLVSFSGCNDDFLERSSRTQLAAGNFWLNGSDAQLAVNGIYDALQARVLYSGNLNATAGIPMHDCFADNAFNNYKYEGPGNFAEARLDPSGGIFDAFWTANYSGIGRANNVIENLPLIPEGSIDDETRNSLMGQALFLSALFYINLAVYFEEVPLILEVQDLEDAYVPKNSYDEIRNSIVSDLETAIGLLPDQHPADEFGYATRGAALSLLARFHFPMIPV